MKRTLVAVVAVLSMPAATAQADVFDHTFGRLGLAPAALSGTTGERLNAVTVAPDGSVFAAGYTSPTANQQAMAVAKFTPAGRLDLNFGTLGFAVADQDDATGNVEQARGVVVQSDGKVVISGLAPTSKDPAEAADTDIIVTRFTATGQPDPTFGDGGKKVLDLSTGGDQSWGLVRRADDKLMVVGARGRDGARVDRDFAFIGLTAEGQLDPDWGTAGTPGITYQRETVTLSGTTYEMNENPRGATVAPDGKILIGNYAQGTVAPANAVTRPHIFRLLTSGLPDPSFGTAGLASFDLNGAAPNTSESYALAVQSDGKIISVGYGNTGTPANVNLLVTRLTSDGRLDTTFATNGVFSYDAPAGLGDRARNVVVTPDDKILVVGTTEVAAGNTNALLIKLTKDGARDAAFGDNGVLSADLGGTTDALFGLALTPDRKAAVAVGWAGTNVNTDDALALRLSFVDPPAPQIITNTVTNTVTVPAAAPPKPAAPRASSSAKRTYTKGPRRLSGTVSTPANVSKVLVRLTRGSGSACRAYQPGKGTFSGRACTSGKGFAVAYADGKWTLDLAKKLAKGAYTLEVVAYGLDGVAQSAVTKAKLTVKR